MTTEFERGLKPCPFCGGEATIYTPTLPMAADCDDVYVKCLDCDAMGPPVLFDQDSHDADDLGPLRDEAVAAWNRRALPVPAAPTANDDADEAYELGKRDGYNEAVQEIDVLTGGDGEYRYCTDHDPDRHCPDAETMKARIVDRFNAAPEPNEETVDARLDLQYAAGMKAAAVRLAPFVNKDGTEALNEVGHLAEKRSSAALAVMRETAGE